MFEEFEVEFKTEKTLVLKEGSVRGKKNRDLSRSLCQSRSRQSQRMKKDDKMFYSSNSA